jgi:hypothetical protein
MARTTAPRPVNADAIIAEAHRTVADLTDGRKLTPLDMLKLGHARRTLAQLA